MRTEFDVADLTPEVIERIQSGGPVVIVEESPEYPGQLLFQTMEQGKFVVRYSEFLSPLSLLGEMFMLGPFVDQLDEDGWHVVFLPEVQPLLEHYRRWCQSLEIEGLGCDLFPFQQFSLNRALDMGEDGFFFNWAPGSGKGTAAAAGAQELLLNQQTYDRVLFFTLRRNKINMARRVEDLTKLTAVVPDGTKRRRQKQYAAGADVVVLNYEKCRHDFDELAELIHDECVLFICDEVQIVLYGENGTPNLSRRGLDSLIREKARQAMVWPMSGSVVKASPMRYHDVFDLQGQSHNPLGTREEFASRYTDMIKEYSLPDRPWLKLKDYRWNQAKLTDVRHRVGHCTQAVRKTDKGVREFFKGISTQVIPIQLSAEDRRLYDAIVQEVEELSEESVGFSVGQHYNLLRYVCLTPEILSLSESKLAAQFAEDFPHLITTGNSAKMEMLGDKLEEIAGAGDQAVVFCSLNALGVRLIAKYLTKRGIQHVIHHGEMSDKDSQVVQDHFKGHPKVTAFVSTDAGAYGLNFQNARYVINYDIPYDPDLLVQRNDRIDRADSHLDGLTSYLLVTDDSVEQRIWRINQDRRALSAATQGTVETLSRMSADELREFDETRASSLGYLMFGKSDPLRAK
jgi:hypothetical protein